MTSVTRKAYGNERGDTLVEVTMALAILALVLTSAFAIANKAYRIGQDAKERSQLVGDAQQQAEALQSFRDSHTWHDFTLGSSDNTLPGLARLGTPATTNACGSQPCFHMETRVVNGINQWVPVAGAAPDTQIGGQGYIRIVVGAGVIPSSTRPSYDFRIEYGIPPRGGGAMLASDLKLHLTNLDALRP
jgi:type II secretory pathway pseudopilin PulG